MGAPLESSMPQFTQLGYSCEVVLEALDPTDGSAVTGVVFSAVELWADVGVSAADAFSLFSVANPLLLGTG